MNTCRFVYVKLKYEYEVRFHLDGEMNIFDDVVKGMDIQIETCYRVIRKKFSAKRICGQRTK